MIELLTLAAGALGLALLALFAPEVLAILFGGVAVFCIVIAILGALPAKKRARP